MTNREQYREEIEVYARNNTMWTFLKKHNIADPEELSLFAAFALFILWLDEEYVAPEPVPEHDGCAGCKHEYLEASKHPCRVCKQNYMDQYERA